MEKMKSNNDIWFSYSKVKEWDYEETTEDTYDTNKAWMVWSLAVTKNFKQWFAVWEICQEYLHYPWIQFVLSWTDVEIGWWMFCKFSRNKISWTICGIEDNGFKLPVIVKKPKGDPVVYDIVSQNIIYIHTIWMRSTSTIKIHQDPSYLYIGFNDFRYLNRSQNQSLLWYYWYGRSGLIQRWIKCYKMTAHLYCAYKDNIICPGAAQIYYDANGKVKWYSDIKSESFIWRYWVYNTESVKLSEEFPWLPVLHIDRARAIPELTFKYNELVSKVIEMWSDNQSNNEEKVDLASNQLNEVLMESLYKLSLNHQDKPSISNEFDFKTEHQSRNRKKESEMKEEAKNNELEVPKFIEYITATVIDRFGQRLVTEEKKLYDKVVEMNEKKKTNIKFEMGADYSDSQDFYGGVVFNNTPDWDELDGTIDDIDIYEEIIDEETTDPKLIKKCQIKLLKLELKLYISNKKASLDPQMIARRAGYGYYPTLERLKEDVEIWIDTLEFRYQEWNIIPESKSYFTNLKNMVHQQINDGWISQKFDDVFIDDFKKFMKENNKFQRLKGEWNKTCPKISKFEILTSFDKSTDELVSTSKKFVWDGTWCDDLSKLGPYNSALQTWKTECPWRLNKTEWNDDWGWKGSADKWWNSEIRNRMGLVMNKDVKSDVKAWGMDHYTFYAILLMMPWWFVDVLKNKFVDEIIKPQLLLCDDKGWDLVYCLKQILNNPNIPEIFQTFTKILYSVLITYPAIKEEYYRIHNIGVWVVWTKREGIKWSQLVSEYLGEVYHPYRWKEEIEWNHQAQKLKIISQDTRDFYNMIFDRHLNDPEGIDYLIIDPKNKGNFWSRMNHSWDPNTTIISTIVDGKYRLAAYAIKDIKYGDELTFDYFSITDDLEEFENSIWLWGKMCWNGRYLAFESERSMNIVSDKAHCYIQRVYSVILVSWYSTELTEDDKNFLSKHHVGKKLLDKSPNWLKKWLALIWRYIDYEYNNFSELAKKWKKLTHVESLETAKNVYDQRINGLWATVDMVVYQLRLMNTDEPPLVKLTDAEVIDKLWKGNDSIREQLIQTLEHLEPSSRKTKLLEKLKIEINESKFDTEEKFINEIFLRFRRTIESLSKIYSCKVYLEALKDILFLYTNVKNYFKINPKYKEVLGEPVLIQRTEYDNEIKLKSEMQNENIVYSQTFSEAGEEIYEFRIKYKPCHIFEKLVWWFKQVSIFDYENVFLLEKRGNITYPKLTSFIFPNTDGIQKKSEQESGDGFKSLIQSKVSQNEFPDLIISNQENNQFRKYPHKIFVQREAFLGKWRENYSDFWDDLKGWNYNNPYEMMGSVQLEECLQNHNEDITIRYEEFFKKVVIELIKL